MGTNPSWSQSVRLALERTITAGGALVLLLAPRADAQSAKLTTDSAWQPGTSVSFAVSTPANMPGDAKCILFGSVQPPLAPFSFKGVEVVVDLATAFSFELPSQPQLSTLTWPTEKRWHKEYVLPASLPAGVTLHFQALVMASNGVVNVSNGTQPTTQATGSHELVFSFSSQADAWSASDGLVKYNVVDVDAGVLVADVLSSKMPNSVAGQSKKMVGSPSKSDGPGSTMAAATYSATSAGSLVASDTLLVKSDGSHLWLKQPPTDKAWKRHGPPRFRPGDDSVVWVLERYAEIVGACPGGSSIQNTNHDLVAYDPGTGLSVQRFPIEASSDTLVDLDDWEFDASGSYACFPIVSTWQPCSSVWARLRVIPFTGPVSLGAAVDVPVHSGNCGIAGKTLTPVPESTQFLMTVTINPGFDPQSQATYLVDASTGAVSQPITGIGSQSRVGAASRSGEFFLYLHKDPSQAGKLHVLELPPVLAPGAALELLTTYTIQDYGVGSNPWPLFYDLNAFVPSKDGSIVFGPTSFLGTPMYRLSPNPTGMPELMQFDPYLSLAEFYNLDREGGDGVVCGVGLSSRNEIFTSTGWDQDDAAGLLSVTTMTACDWTPGTASIDVLVHSYAPYVSRL